MRDTSPIIIDNLDNENILHIESETSPDFIQDFTDNLDAIIKDQQLKNKMK